MKVTISHVHAAYHWLMSPVDGRVLAQQPRSGTLGQCPAGVQDLGRAEFRDYEVEGLQTEFLVDCSGNRPRQNLYRYHVSQREYPNNAFVVLDVNLQIAGPELSFWQMAEVLPLGELVKYGNALCAKHCYLIDCNGHLTKREAALTTQSKLESFARLMGAPRTRRKVLQALRSVVDGCESPMENSISVMLCLKRQYGGFGMPKPEMGHVIVLDEVARKIYGTETCRCDMYWPEASYDLEYDSSKYHVGRDAEDSDAMRRMAIRHMGVHVEELRRAQVVDADKFELAARVVAQGIGWRIRKRSREEELKHSWAYSELRKQLFSWERREAGEPSSPLHVAGIDW